jgi:NodT family efflux transporter outer membrane factor (OMF) lipoprotein
VVLTAIQEAGLRQQIAASQKLLAIAHDLTVRLEGQRAIGAASQLDVLTQTAAEAQIAATLPPLEKQLAQSRDALTALLGLPSAEEPAETIALADLTLPDHLPVSLPSHLVEQRPDVRQAEEIMHQASAEVGIAIADMLPQFALTGGIGNSSQKLSQWFGPGNGFWSLGSSLSQTLFDAGALLHRRRAADAGLDQAGALYRATVIAALQNVADALQALQSDAELLRASVISWQAARQSWELSRQQQRLGGISLVALLNAEQTYLQAEIALANAQTGRFADSAALFQALGGGWWNRPEEGSKP